ncbi:UDP-glucose 4-epimerase family protein [Pseudomonas guariconensis]|uniref:UDP-glucose 4-epimerase family protein n=1 Tax=Pseudomonas guariconensis TaxID=1288410 RepID=UPI002D1E6791|nr:SDR family oxidoreductase [Pseudomonas guariconensis]MEB3842302.1 SDR family oxidoreductase [Pseudomonas guariconensis]MEB3875170.1 SDR family oxidoreductase [Pseudomonas guariconensis]MEB3877078.1 SDR family oxidoreductase [Pseudomonas guariconensis]MEB3894707.1 SDR family oxidoreductase [Pseudomonas guariconensis]
MNRHNILITGATGFVGSQLVSKLLCDPSLKIFAGVRKKEVILPEGVESFFLGDLGNLNSSCAFDGVRVVVHCAARVHVMNDKVEDPLTEFRRVNVQGTIAVARLAAEAGVERFIFISSIKVNGESTDNRLPYTADETPSPVDPYGISKLEAERALQDIAAETGMEVVIIRPVLIYGAGVSANFESMMVWLRKKIPLPLGSIRNKRSIVAVDNLIDLIRVCLAHPEAANEVFLVSDDEDLSTPELLRRVASALGVKAILLPLPIFIIHAVARILGRREIAARLCSSLQVDISKTKEKLDWVPPVRTDQALFKTTHHFLEKFKK